MVADYWFIDNDYWFMDYNKHPVLQLSPYIEIADYRLCKVKVGLEWLLYFWYTALFSATFILIYNEPEYC